MNGVSSNSLLWLAKDRDSIAANRWRGRQAHFFLGFSRTFIESFTHGQVSVRSPRRRPNRPVREAEPYPGMTAEGARFDMPPVPLSGVHELGWQYCHLGEIRRVFLRFWTMTTYHVVVEVVAHPAVCLGPRSTELDILLVASPGSMGWEAFPIVSTSPGRNQDVGPSLKSSENATWAQSCNCIGPLV